MPRLVEKVSSTSLSKWWKRGMSNDVRCDGTVRNSLGDLIQLTYGEDRMHGSWSSYPDPTSAAPKDSTFIESFFAIPDDEGSIKMKMERVLETDGVNLKADTPSSSHSPVRWKPGNHFPSRPFRPPRILYPGTVHDAPTSFPMTASSTMYANQDVPQDPKVRVSMSHRCPSASGSRVEKESVYHSVSTHWMSPHFSKDDFSPEGYFFHATAGQEDLVDTAVKTARQTISNDISSTCWRTSYPLPRLSLRPPPMPVGVKYLSAKIVSASSSPEYSWMEHVRTSVSQNRVRIVFARVLPDGARTHLCQPKSCPHRLRQGTPRWSTYAPLSAKIVSASSSPRYSSMKHPDSHCMPVNLHCIIQSAARIFHIDCCKSSDLEPTYTVDAVHQLHGEVSREAQANASLTFRMHVRATLTTRRILEEFHLNREVFEWVLGEIEAKFNHTLVNPGGMCGTLATQSIGETATQTTLNAFHYAVVSSKNATLGVPRLKEIINVATNIKTLSLSVYLESDMAQDRMSAKNVQQELAYTSLRTVTAAVEIWYDPEPTSTITEEDTVFVESFFAILDEEIETIDWTLTVVADCIAENFKTDLLVIWSEGNLEEQAGYSRRRRLPPPIQEHDVELGQPARRTYPIFLLEHNETYADDEGNIKTNGGNVGFTHTYLNSQRIETFNALGIEAARVAITKEMRGVIEFNSSTLMATAPHGINHADTDALMRRSWRKQLGF
ncbi:hypothetical protein M404DRAFT_20005 [Pisolithus tinctorius Marx 270]|uniref:DNA-directed RNA polymerase n=1 Tax=Pisolithus tinctorius Marx 270 TaxID=870435 RepID=A0A0C3PSM4_PISTI|nr:hypothetical protein M404DRAFT_20005 [Pisolithus tinctorius Marx 270]